MGTARPIQASFSQGVMSPDLMARTDIEQYYRAARVIKNGIVLPQGGVTKRHGMKRLKQIDLSVVAPYFDCAGGLVRIIPYLKDGKVYLVIISSSGHLLVISEEGAEVKAFTDISDRIFGDAIEQLQYKQIVNDLVILSEYTAPFVIIRDPSGVFNINDVPNLIVPTGSFSEDWDGTTGGRWRKVRVDFDGMNNGDVFTLGLRNDTELVTYTFTYNVDLLPFDGSSPEAGESVSVMVADIAAQTGMSVTPLYEITPKQAVDSQGLIVDVNLQEFVGLEMAKTDDFKLLCVSKSSHYAKVKCMPINKPVELASPADLDSWNDNRGYPSVAGEYGGRFILAASGYQPETIWMSKIYQYYDFSVTAGGTVATDAIEVTLATEKVSKITGIIDSRRLTVFTNRTAYILGGQGEDVITPDTVQARNINIKGAKLIRPETLDNTICYIQQSGAELNSTSYEFTKDDYISVQSSIYSNHLLNEIRQMSKTLSNKDFNAEYLTCLNRDGSMANFSSLSEQELKNWTEFNTIGKVEDIVGVKSNNYVVVRRGNSDSIILTVERMSEDAQYCDSAQSVVSSVPFNKLGGFTPFIGQELVAIADGYDIDLNVDENGIVTLPFSAKELTIGVPMEWEVEPMPLNVDFKSGSIVNLRKRILEAILTLKESRGITIEYAGRNYSISERNVGFLLGEPPQPFTGIKKKRLTGWIDRGNIKVKSRRPVPATLLGVELTVKAKG